MLQVASVARCVAQALACAYWHKLKCVPQRVALPATLLATSLFWAYWPTLRDMAERWAHEPQYSHGYLVPAFALFLLWTRRRQLATVRYQSSWWGIGILLTAGLLRFVAA